MRKKPNHAARMEKCAHLLVTEPKSLYGLWRGTFGYDELYVELGCGKGAFTVGTAKEESGIFIVALEKSIGALLSALERANDAGLRNVRFINALADNLTEYFAPGETSRIYINFCDPWPTNRHAKRRLTNRRFIELYRQVLRPGGGIYFKTDDLPLFEYSLGEFESGGFMLAGSSRDLHKDGPVGIMSDYEAKFHSQRKPIYMARFLLP